MSAIPPVGPRAVDPLVRTTPTERVRWRDETVCVHCAEACKRGGLPDDGPVVFVGDGYSDRCAALAADRVFARDGLARYLDRKGVRYEPFTDFEALTRTLRSSA